MSCNNEDEYFLVSHTSFLIYFFKLQSDWSKQFTSVWDSSVSTICIISSTLLFAYIHVT